MSAASEVRGRDERTGTGVRLRVLFVGAANDVIIGPLAATLKASIGGLRLAVVGLKRLGGNESAARSFDHIHPSLEGSQIHRRSRRRGTGVIGLLMQTCFSWRALSKFFKERRQDTDLIHVHGMFMSPLHVFLGQSSPLPYVVTLWGSDVFRQSSLPIAGLQKKLLNGAAQITVSGPEFREVVLSKYGRHLLPRISYAFFDPTLGDILSVDPDEARDRTRERLNVPAGRLLVCVGHNGYPGNQHLELIASLGAIDSEWKDRIHVVVPMTYGGDCEYKQEVESQLESSGLSGCLLTEFLPDCELADFRRATDILVYAPISDAFSATVSQALACGTVVLLGSWLPYKSRRQAGMHYWEMDSTEDAGRRLLEVLRDWKASVEACRPNRERSERFFDPRRLGTLWEQAYSRALEHDSATENGEPHPRLGSVAL